MSRDGERGAAPDGVDSPRPHLCVVVLGDLGCSPRATYHAWAAAETGFEVDLVGELATPLLDRIAAHPSIRVHPLTRPARIVWASGWKVTALVRAVGRVVRQCFELWHSLRALPRLETLLVQSPPAIPTLAIAWLVARRCKASLVVDWHNFGFSMLAQRLGGKHPLVRLARAYEWGVGRRADGHLCVSKAMADVLRTELRVANVVVLYDRPAEHFRPLSVEHKAQARHMLAVRYGYLELATPGTALAVSPTSFTPEEDMSLLFDALVRYGDVVRRAELLPDPAVFPPLLVVLSGKGELREPCEMRARELQAYAVSVAVLWVEAEHYPDLIAAADLGICLHRSTSGVDLPMKVADMLGAGIPVCAFDYGPCLREQIDVGVSGLLFGDAEGLSQALSTLLENFPRPGQLSAMTQAVLARPRLSFADEWRRVALCLFASSTDCENGRKFPDHTTSR